MSHFASTHLVTKFITGESAPLTGQRLAKVTYKTTAKQAAKFPSVCASLPMVGEQEITEHLGSLVPHIRNMLATAQDGILRSLYESSGGLLTSVQDSEISITACIGYLTAEASGGRLTKESIEGWYKESAAETITALIGEKLGYSNDDWTEEQTATVAKHSTGWRDLYSKLAGGATVLQEVQIKNLKMVLELVDTSEIGGKLLARLVEMEKVKPMVELLELL